MSRDDSDISALYSASRQGHEPPPQVDQAILDAARRRVKRRHFRYPTLALAASVVLAAGIAILHIGVPVDEPAFELSAPEPRPAPKNAAEARAKRAPAATQQSIRGQETEAAPGASVALPQLMQRSAPMREPGDIMTDEALDSMIPLPEAKHREADKGCNIDPSLSLAELQATLQSAIETGDARAMRCLRRAIESTTSPDGMPLEGGN